MKKDILIYFKKINSKDKTNISKDILWYDSLRKKMQKYRGGKMVMRHRLENNDEKEVNRKPVLRLLPVIEDDFEIQKKVNIDSNSVKDWYKIYTRYNNSESEISSISSDGVIISVPKEEIEDVSYDLDRNGFHYNLI